MPYERICHPSIHPTHFIQQRPQLSSNATVFHASQYLQDRLEAVNNRPLVIRRQCDTNPMKDIVGQFWNHVQDGTLRLKRRHSIVPHLLDDFQQLPFARFAQRHARPRY